jgi:CRISPR-associated protein Csy1
MEPNITKFLEDKKAAYLKNKLKANTSEQETKQINDDAQKKFSLKEWLQDSASRAKQLSYTTHPAKFSHPDIKRELSLLITLKDKKEDGLLRTGNTQEISDVVGNAACLDVHKFLSIKLSNNLSIIENLQQETDLIKKTITSTGLSYAPIRNEYMQINQTEITNKSSAKLKQVYFPINPEKNTDTASYHLLSLLTSSSILYQLKSQIQDINFSEENKDTRAQRDNAKDKNDYEFTGKINQVKNLTSIGFGGSQPQNVSALNSQHGGVSFLLNSMPPVLDKRKTQPPKNDFYTNTLWVNDNIKSLFIYLNKMVNSPVRENMEKRKKDILQQILFQIHLFALRVRKLPQNWSNYPTYDNLPKWQKIYLDEAYQNIRDTKEKNHSFKEKCLEESARWITNQYRELFSVNIGDAELKEFSKILKQSKEIIR